MATKVLDIQITRKHITESMKRNSKHCAIANAIQNSDDNIAWATVTETYIDVAYHAPEQVFRYRTPGKAAAFVREFDNPEAADPKPFRLMITEDEWINTRPRRMNQKQQQTTVRARKTYAAQTGRRLEEVKADDVPVEVMQRVTEDAQKTPVVRPKQEVKRTDRIKRNQRNSTSDRYEIEEARRQMELA